MTRFTWKKVQRKGIGIQVAQWPGDGTTVLAVHGITANCMVWKPLASAISPVHPVVAMDLRGRGRSDKPDTGYSIDHHLADMQNTLADLGLNRVVLMGHSLGAFISLAFAAEFPERTEGLILIDGGGSMTPEKWATVANAIQPTKERLGKRYSDRSSYLNAMRSLPYFQPWTDAKAEPFEYELVTEGNQVRCSINPDHIQEEAANIRKISPESYYSKIPCKTLILRATKGLTGVDDILLPETAVNRMTKGIVSTEIVSIAGANHYSILSDPSQERDQSILKYLSEL